MFLFTRLQLIPVMHFILIHSVYTFTLTDKHDKLIHPAKKITKIDEKIPVSY